MQADSSDDMQPAGTRSTRAASTWPSSALFTFLLRPEVSAGVIALLVFLTTIQTTINGSSDPYATDIGEIQNALPRWGTLHFTGYPQYSFLGSLFVTLLRPLGIKPALGASLYSALWGALSISLLVALMRRFAIPAAVAIVTALLFALSTSMWIDASVAELHTMTLALILGILLAAIDWQRQQEPRSLYWLAFLSGQGFAHQRSIAFMGLGLLVLLLPHWRLVWRQWPKLLLLGLTGPLTYLYLPLRAWMGASWTFSAPGTWTGFWTIVLDTKAERIISFPSTLAGWLERSLILNELLAADWPWLLLLPGLAAVIIAGSRIQKRERGTLTLIWLTYYGLSLIIWEGRVSDALLAVKMPVTLMGAIGLALATQSIWLWRERLGQGLFIVWLVCAAWLFVNHRPVVTAITRDQTAQSTIAIATRAENLNSAQPITLMSLWGNDYWQLAYAQDYEGQLSTLNLVDHNANFSALLANDNRLLTLSQTFYQRPLSWWEARLGGNIFLHAPAPSLVEVATNQTEANGVMSQELDNGIGVGEVHVSWADQNTLWVQLAWLAPPTPIPDYSIAVHVLKQTPLLSPDDIVAQADRAHPVDGWYPTSLWSPGELVRDAYAATIPAGAAPEAVRISMYRQLDDGSFANTNWLTFAVPARPGPAS